MHASSTLRLNFFSGCRIDLLMCILYLLNDSRRGRLRELTLGQQQYLSHMCVRVCETGHTVEADAEPSAIGEHPSVSFCQ